ncbi:MAG: hypothetical protein DWH96_01240 [Planctomycetota bacterium]|nr:MAG: hypothetical protein DWH96_01240 [Planctomycetota bacterium]RLS95282.1 MAG: hypothetical protein DWI11_03050 [Planctomycetota bacterium]
MNPTGSRPEDLPELTGVHGSELLLLLLGGLVTVVIISAVVYLVRGAMHEERVQESLEREKRAEQGKTP